MKKCNIRQFEREFGFQYQELPPEHLVERRIGRRIEGYCLEFDVYTMQLQEQADLYRQMIEDMEVDE